MTTAKTKPTIHEALSAVMDAVQAVGKTDRNQQQGFSFRGIDSVMNAVGPALREHRVVVVPLVEDTAYGSVEVGAGDRRREIPHVIVTVRYRFYGPAGDAIDAVTVGEAMDSGDKAVPKAMSVAFRTALLQALCLPTDEPDPDSQTFEVAGRRRHDEHREPEPTDEQVALVRHFIDEIKVASLRGLDAIAVVVREAVSAKKLLPRQRKQVLDHWERRKAELEARAATKPAEPTEEAPSE